ncbi:hypothetical protein [Gymnodinialimonas hymeniacidonis]|uniref:hypothetical protein n=1 Tax=Gymnodinialimonas hymeniacidonis TaxID=3126508 RepID=UPI0034C65329
MIPPLRLGAVLLLAAVPAFAQSVVPVPRPSEAERAAAAEARAAEDAETQAVPAVAEATRPLTQEETASFITQVRACWNTGNNAEAGNVAVVVRFSMTPEAEPIPNTFELVSASVDDQDAADLAFLAARRAVIRCGEAGYDLPAAAFPYWERVEINFDPSQTGGN